MERGTLSPGGKELRERASAVLAQAGAQSRLAAEFAAESKRASSRARERLVRLRNELRLRALRFNPVGRFVVDRTSGRSGIVRQLVRPRPGNRSCYVEWEGGGDFSLMSVDELQPGEAFPLARAAWADVDLTDRLDLG